MDAKAEAADLKANPLPPVVIVDPLSRVWDLDGEIARLQEQISELQQQRTEALEYAVSHQIAEDTRCRLEKKVRKSRILDVAKFRDTFPEEFMTVCDIERRDLENQLGHLGERIPLTLVDKLVKKPVLEAANGVITVKESVNWGVVLK